MQRLFFFLFPFFLLPKRTDDVAFVVVFVVAVSFLPTSHRKGPRSPRPGSSRLPSTGVPRPPL